MATAFFFSCQLHSLCLLALVIGAPPRVPPGLALGQGQVWEEGGQGPLDLVRFAAQSVFGGAVVRALAVEAHIVGCQRTKEVVLAQLAVNHPGSYKSPAPVMSLKCCNNAELMPVNGPLIQLCPTLGWMKLFSFPEPQFLPFFFFLQEWRSRWPYKLDWWPQNLLLGQFFRTVWTEENFP